MAMTNERLDALPATMRAMVIRGFGEPGVFEAATLPVPGPRRGEVLVRVAATSVNPADTKIRRHGGPLAPVSGVLGMDVAGTVVALGEGVTDYRVGDRVFGCAGGLGALQGALAEYMRADVRLVAPAPSRVSLREAAALPLVAITAYEGLFDRARLAPREHVLVLGAAGGVGHVATQLAARHGARVAAVVSNEDKAALARALGATDIVFRDAEPLEAAAQRLTGGRGFDLVFDASGNDNFAAVFAATRPQGRVVSLVTRHVVDLSPLHARALSLHAVMMLVPMLHDLGRERHAEILREVAAAVDAGALRPLVDPGGFALADVARAHAHLESGRALGKVLVDVDAQGHAS